MTDHDMAELLDPGKAKFVWWETENYWCHQREKWTKIGEPSLCVPKFTTDDLAAFRYVRPVLLAAGCEILSQPRVNQVTCPLMDGIEVFPRNPLDAAYAAATTAAIQWLRDNQPETLNRAIAQVGVK